MLQNLLTTKCAECGTELTGKNLMPPFIEPNELGIEMQGFYGNRVKKFMNAKCGCGKEYIAFLTTKNNGYKIVDIAEKQTGIKANKSQQGIPGQLDSLSRKDLVNLAIKLGFEGRAAATKSKELKEFVKSKQND